MVSRSRIAALGLALLAPPSQAAPPTAPRQARSIDYRVPQPKDLFERVRVLDAAKCVDCPEVVQYTAWNSEVLTRTQYTGKHVRLLLSPTWMSMLSETARRTLIERLDLHYEMFAELHGEEPNGSGLLTVALVNDTCGWGCGYVGYKGIEILDYPDGNAAIRPALEAGYLHDVFVHELTHNFDKNSLWLFPYLPDAAHAWTDFIGAYGYSYTRQGGSLERAPGEILDDEAARRFGPYVDDPAATWGECVRDAACTERGISADSTWGGMNLRIAQLHGLSAVRGSLEFLREYRQSHGGPFEPESQEDLHVQALSAGTGRNLACYVDAWSWTASPELRSWMTAKYGTTNANCDDTDGDGLTPLAGDCNDASAAVRPGAAETSNGVDDDCNGAIDDLLASEFPQGDFFPNPKPLGYPSRVAGRITTGDFDSFTIDLASARRVRFELCSPTPAGLSGWFFVYDQDGSWHHYAYLDAGRCNVAYVNLDRAGSWRFGFEPNHVAQFGAYRVGLRDGQPWLESWGTSAAPDASCGVRLTSVTQSLASTSDAPTHVRYWVSGIGFVGTVRYAPATFVDWYPGPDVPAGTYGYRAQLLSVDTPVSDVTGPQYFSVHSEPTSPPVERAILRIAAPSPALAQLTWTAIEGAVSYDVVRGDLSMLRASGGDFEASTTGCFADGALERSVEDAEVPPAGAGFWYLVRGVSCGGRGTYDSSLPPQTALRDLEIEQSGFDCP